MLWDYKHVSHWYAGKLDRDPNFSLLVPEAYFFDEFNVAVNEQAFGRHSRTPELTRRILAMADYLKGNADTISSTDTGSRFSWSRTPLCLPVHIPLGVALAQFIAETGIPTIGHHHDFWWERSRFSVNAVGDFLEMAFPLDAAGDPARDDQFIRSERPCMADRREFHSRA